MTHTEKFNQIMAASAKPRKQKQQAVKVHQIEPRENMNSLQDALSKCTYSDNVLSLPFERLENYDELRKALLNAGATYNKSNFVFPSDAAGYINRLMGGESVNIKKDFQFFATPPALAKYLVSIADIEYGQSILEPSAGHGAIIHAIFEKRGHGAPVYYCEIMDVNRAALVKISGAVHVCDDFMDYPESNPFDRIIANPPFNKNQDIDHIRKMYSVLKPAGRIVTIASKHWQLSNNKKETDFRIWLDEIGAVVDEIPSGAFKESGTNISTCIITIDK